jgi:hypothetical protein
MARRGTTAAHASRGQGQGGRLVSGEGQGWFLGQCEPDPPFAFSQTSVAGRAAAGAAIQMRRPEPRRTAGTVEDTVGKNRSHTLAGYCLVDKQLKSESQNGNSDTPTSMK